MQQYTVTADSARETSTGVDEGIDVDFLVTFADGTEISGEVTLLPAQYDGRLSAWGAPDNWVSGAALAKLKKFDNEDFTELLGEIEAATREVAS